MNTTEALEKLDKMQAQIIHGSRIFGEIADVIRFQQKRIAVWQDYAAHQEICATCGSAVSDCHQGTELKKAALSLDAESDGRGSMGQAVLAA